MDQYGPATYGDRIADRYDEWFGLPTDTEEAVAFLADVAGRGPVLELGIGTGRLAIPLAERGLAVEGVDASEAMVAKLHGKPAGRGIQVLVGDFSEVLPDGPFSLVFVAFNTFFALLSQDDQIRCVAGVARRLTEDGAFVIEAFVPDVTRFDRGQRTETLQVETDGVHLEATVHDRATQVVRSQHVVAEESGLRFFPVQIRYAWPSELDLMARLAGLRLRHRFGGWHRQPFGSDSAKHVSVYERAPAPPG